MNAFEKQMRDEDERLGLVAEIASEIVPLKKEKVPPFAADTVVVQEIEDDVGQRLAALRFEINAMDSLQVEGLDEAAELLSGLREEARALATVIQGWEQCVGELMDTKHVAIEGVGTLERHHQIRRTDWQHDDLLRVVLDSDRRPKADGVPGEVESDLDVLRQVYGLRGYNARTTELRARGIDPDEWAETEDRGWSVSIK